MQELRVMEVHGVRVLTTKQIANMYGTEPEIINNNFLRNKSKYVQEKHFIAVSGEEMRLLKTSHQFDGELKRVSRAYFWTEKGALLHAKSLNTDKAWEVYDYLVDFYFRAKEKAPENQPPVPQTYREKRETALAEIKKKEMKAGLEPKKTGYDIAPAFRELISLLPIEALDEMEKCFRKEKSMALKLAATSILAEKMKRQLA